MPPEGGIKTPINPSVIARISGAIGGAIKGASEAWFGPLQPIPPQAPPDVAGRQFDYPIGFNLQYRPKSEYGQTGIDYTTLRAMADPTLGGLDLVRLAIETRKDQMDAQRWTIKPRRERGDDTPTTPAEEEAARAARLKFKKPDGIHPFRTWQRMLMEELFVIDAPTIYLAPAPGGGKIPEVIDGSTIKRLLDPSGRRPPPPQPAYQQALKGLPAVEYTADELLVCSRNVRVERAYGFSPVEQVVTTVNIALRRQLSQLEYYTAGSVPDTVFGVPENWSTKQIQSFQEWWDSILSGDTAERRRARFVPGGVKPFQLKPDQLKDGWDEWLARIICWCFSLPPGALVRDMNRATSETQKESSLQEGLEPIKLWFADLMDDVLERTVENGAALEFAYQDEEVVDPEVKARVHSMATANKPWMTADEVRAEYGMQPLTPEQKAELAPPPPPSFDPFGMDPEPEPSKPEPPPTPPDPPPAAPPPPSEKVADMLRAQGEAITKALKVAKRKGRGFPVGKLNRDRTVARKAREAIERECSKFLRSLEVSVSEAAVGLLGPKSCVEIVEGADWEKLGKAIAPHLKKVVIDGSEMALNQVRPALKRVAKAGRGMSDDTFSSLFSLANKHGVDWANKRAAEIVGMVEDEDGEWTPNPNDTWSIKETTREDINGLVTKSMEEGWSNDKLADSIGESASFSDGRSSMIARTETAMADLEGNRIGWKTSGVVSGRKWLKSDDACVDCEGMDGEEVGIDESFEPDNPPLHPNCRCDEIPIVSDDAELEEEDEEVAERVRRAEESRQIRNAAARMTAAIDTITKRLDQPLVPPKPSVVVFQRDEQGRIIGATTKPLE